MTDERLKYVQDVMDRLPWLFQELGFRVVGHQNNPWDHEYDVDLESGSLRLRIQYGGGGTQAQVAAVTEPDHLTNLRYLLEAIGRQAPPFPPNLEAEATAFRDNFEAIVDAMGPRLAETWREIERRHQLRLQRAMTPRHAELTPQQLPAVRNLHTRRWVRRWMPLVGLVAAVSAILWLVLRYANRT